MISARIFLLRLATLIELGFFGFYAVYGSHGLMAMRDLQEKNNMLEQNIHSREQEISQLKKEIADWQTYPFYREQYAREHLQMAQKDDEVYLI